MTQGRNRPQPVRLESLTYTPGGNTKRRLLLAVRIYSLAKELKLDSKELVDICTKAGVPGKGSALASLTEDEVEKVKQFLKGGVKSKPSKAATPAPQRPAEPARTGKMP